MGDSFTVQLYLKERDSEGGGKIKMLWFAGLGKAGSMMGI